MLREQRAEKVPWKDISAEIEQKFGARRTIKALLVRLDSAVRKQHLEGTSLGSKISWTEEQTNWLRNLAHGKKKIDWNDMAVRFKTRFGLHRNHNSMRCKWVKMSIGKNATGKGDVTGKEETASQIAAGKEE
jgi:hypothetical protein